MIVGGDYVKCMCGVVKFDFLCAIFLKIFFPNKSQPVYTVMYCLSHIHVHYNYYKLVLYSQIHL